MHGAWNGIRRMMEVIFSAHLGHGGAAWLLAAGMLASHAAGAVRTDVSVAYDPTTGGMRLQYTGTGSLSFQSLDLLSRGKGVVGTPTSNLLGLLTGATGTLPVADFRTFNNQASGVNGTYSQLSATSFQQSGFLTLSSSLPGTSNVWDFGRIAPTGWSQATVNATFVTDPDVAPNGSVNEGLGYFLFAQPSRSFELAQVVALPLPSSELTWAGGGPWSTSAVTWTSGTIPTTWDTTKTAVFSGTGGIVSVAAGVTASRGITATTTGYTLSGGTLSLTGASASATDNTISVATAATLALNLPLSGSTGFRKTGAGALVFNQASVISGTASIAAGTIRLANAQSLLAATLRPLAGGTATVAGQGLTTTVAGLDPNAGGLVDVGTGMVTVASGLSPANLVTALLAGRGNGTWNGTAGITSSQAKADLAINIQRSVGWLDNGDGSVSAAYAAPGDTNLDWRVDILDAANFVAGGKFNSGQPATWTEGDFNYDGIVDILDAAEFFATGLYNAGPYHPAPGMGGVVAVPEPTGLGTLAAAFGMLLIISPRLRRSTRVGLRPTWVPAPAASSR